MAENPVTVVAIAGDPGGAAALASVLRQLSEDGESAVYAFAYRQAVNCWSRRGLPFDEMPESADLRDAQDCLTRLGADVLLTATSVNGVDLEKKFIVAARDIGIPSLAVLDFWSNYGLRFSDARDHLCCLPDRIAVMDEQASAEMVTEGFPQDHLVVTGQPAFDELACIRRSMTRGRRRAIRQTLGVPDDETLVVFASQPLTELHGSDYAAISHLGFTETTVLRSLVSALDRISQRRTNRLVLVVRPHPRERKTDLAPYRTDLLRVTVDGSGDGREVVLAADLVVGMNSVLLVEACLLGCPVVSLQPGLRGNDVLPTNRWGLSEAIYDEERIIPALKRWLLYPSTQGSNNATTDSWGVDGRATDRVVDLLIELTHKARGSFEVAAT